MKVEFENISPIVEIEAPEQHLIITNMVPAGEGASGVPGPQGPMGPQGAQGPVGPVGATGPAGPTGEQGIPGVSNVPGPVGPSGPQGAQGPQGVKGDQGIQGPKGDKGDQGDQGIQGPQGIQGNEGPVGPAGSLTNPIPANTYISNITGGSAVPLANPINMALLPASNVFTGSINTFTNTLRIANNNALFEFWNAGSVDRKGYLYAPLSGDLILKNEGVGKIVLDSPSLQIHTAGVERVRVTADAKVGINTTNPLAYLHSVCGDASIGFGVSGLTKGLRIMPSADAMSVDAVSADLTSTWQPLLLRGLTVGFSVGGVPAMTVDAAGFVGIGTTTPGRIFEIASTNPIMRLRNTGATTEAPYGIEWIAGPSSEASLALRPSIAELRMEVGRSVGWGGKITFVTDLVERARITPLGDFCVGTPTPQLASGGRGNISINGVNDSLLAFSIADVLAGYLYAAPATFDLLAAGGRALTFTNTGGERMRIAASGNVGVGTSNPVARLHAHAADGGSYQFGVSGTTKGLRMIADATRFTMEAVDNTLSATYQPLVINGSQLDLAASGVVSIVPAGVVHVTFDSNAAVFRKRMITSYTGSAKFEVFDGTITTKQAELMHDGSSFAFTNLTPGGAVYLSSSGAGPIVFAVNGVSRCAISGDGLTFSPWTDGGMNLGAPSNKWAVVYAVNGAINTSDERAKTPLTPLTETELAAAKDIARGIGSYRWLDTVKADDKLHIGVVAQAVIAAMEAQGLDALSYGFVRYDEWDAVEGVEAIEGVPAVTDKATGEVIHEAIEPRLPLPGREAGDSYGVNYSELSMFIAAAQEQRLAALEALLP